MFFYVFVCTFMNFLFHHWQIFRRFYGRSKTKDFTIFSLHLKVEIAVRKIIGRISGIPNLICIKTLFSLNKLFKLKIIGLRWKPSINTGVYIIRDFKTLECRVMLGWNIVKSLFLFLMLVYFQTQSFFTRHICVFSGEIWQIRTIKLLSKVLCKLDPPILPDLECNDWSTLKFSFRNTSSSIH